jgi:CBS domain-containing protein
MLKLGSRKGINLARWTKPETHVMDIASKKPVTCGIDQKVRDVLPVFVKKFRRLPVIDRENRVRGMLSAADILHVLGGWGRYGRIRPPERLDTRIRRVMSPHLALMDKNVELPKALSFFKKHKHGAYPVLYRKRLVGIVTEWDIVRQMRGNTGVKVADIMVRKPLVAQDSYGIVDVAKMLAMGGFRRLPVVRKGLLVGMVTPRDILRFLLEKKVPHRLQSQTQPVKSIMERRVVAIKPDQDVHEAVKIMVGKKIGGLPVMEDHDVIGIVTERDVVDVVEF